jgi:hypothetical protein
MDFIERICTNKFDDTPRLLFADWLDENARTVTCSKCESCSGRGGRSFPPRHMGIHRCGVCRGSGRVPNGNAARAEFIRVQCELARGLVVGVDAAQHVASVKAVGGFNTRESEEIWERYVWLQRRERELWGVLWPSLLTRVLPGAESGGWNQSETTGAIRLKCGGWLTNVRFRRGLVAELTCNSSVWLGYADVLYKSMGRCHNCINGYVPTDMDNNKCENPVCVKGWIPLPCPATAQPIEVLRLTDINDETVLACSTVVLDWQENNARTIKYHESARWPGLKVVFPGDTGP